MLAFALRADGWFLRSDIIWAKKNCMPESVTDRPTKSHEYIFMLTKSARYFFDQEAVREKYQDSTIARDAYGYNHAFANQFRGSPTDARHPNGKELPPGSFAKGPDGRRKTSVQAGDGSIQHRDGERWPNGGRNVRSVWEIATQPYAEAHFATYPQELVRRCLLAGCPEWVCAGCGRPVPHVEYSHGSSTTASMRTVRDDLPEGSAIPGAVLLKDMRRDSDCASQTDNARLRDEREGLQVAANAGSPDGESRGLRDGASVRDGGDTWQASDVGRDRSSQERHQGRQSSGELGSHAEAVARSKTQTAEEANHLSALRRGDHHVWTCPACGSGQTTAGVILDPFLGSGTTALVARNHSRRSIGIELNQEYCELAARRLAQQSLLAGEAA